MSASSASSSSLPTLLLQSKSALHRGQALCTRANDLSISSASLAVDALALDAKVRWMTDGVLEQLKMAADIAKSLATKRAKLQEEIRNWDALRDEATESLDSQLDRLSHILVPPATHEVPVVPGLPDGLATVDPFHKGEDEEEESGQESKREVYGQGSKREANGVVKKEKKKWKRLRDFVSEAEVDDVLEKMEADRTILDDVLTTPDIPAPPSLVRSISHLRSSLPPHPPTITSAIQLLLSQQEETTTTMSIQLESLTAHFEQMVMAEEDERNGVEIGPEDLDVLVRDTQELQPILEELDQAVGSMASLHEQLKSASDSPRAAFTPLDATLNTLEAVFVSMSEVAYHLTVVEESIAQTLPLLNAHLSMVNSLQDHFRQVELAYHALVIELDRRKKSRSRAEAIIAEMQVRLDTWRADEAEHRDRFLTETAEWLPENVCPSMGEAPDEWHVQRVGGGDLQLDESAVADARKELNYP